MLPVSLKSTNILLKPLTKLPDFPQSSGFKTRTNLRSFSYYHDTDNILDVVERIKRCHAEFFQLEINFRSFSKTFSSSIYLYMIRDGRLELCRLLRINHATLLSIDFSQYKSYDYKKSPKYLKITKSLKLLSQTKDQALFQVDTFPYDTKPQFFHHSAYDFAKHSLVLGGSGSGKSKFLMSLIDKIYRASPKEYKIIVIDPHDALKADCGDVSERSVIDFQTTAGSIDLFQTNADDINVGVELMLTLFQALIGHNYNSQLERVLRYASFLLMTAQSFSFLHLRKLLTNVEYRNQIINEQKEHVPTSVTRFFLADFDELRTHDYNDAIAPIVAFVDEMQMVPVFDQEFHSHDLATTVQENFLSVFSLSRPRLGNKVTQTIAGLLMQQIFLFAQKNLIDQHLIVVIDEVAIVENPILSRFLSELRKYKTSVILAGQYFSQFSPDLRSAIFANTSNYYIFRVSKDDSELLVHNLNIKLASDDSIENRQAVLTELKAQECFVQVSQNGETLPGLKAKTTDFNPSPVSPEDAAASRQDVIKLEQPHTFSFTLDVSTSAAEVMQAASTGRRPLAKPKDKNA